VAIIGANALFTPDISSLVKRKGGGGGKGGGSSGGSSGSKGGSSSSSSGGSSSGGTRSGVSPSYGGSRGSYYGGGATTAYRSGGRTPLGLLPIGLLGVASLTFFAGAWLWPVYAYPYSHPYNFYNRTALQNQTKNVLCLCQQYSDCGCDDNDDQTFLNTVVGDGTNLNSTLVRAAVVNGTQSIILNGTLPNGTSETSAAVGQGMRMSWVFGWMAISAVTFMVL